MIGAVKNKMETIRTAFNANRFVPSDKNYLLNFKSKSGRFKDFNTINLDQEYTELAEKLETEAKQLLQLYQANESKSEKSPKSKSPKSKSKSLKSRSEMLQPPPLSKERFSPDKKVDTSGRTPKIDTGMSDLLSEGPEVDVISGMGGIPGSSVSDEDVEENPDNPDDPQSIFDVEPMDAHKEILDEYIAFDNYQDAIDYAQGLIEKYEKLMRFPGNTRETNEELERRCGELGGFVMVTSELLSEQEPSPEPEQESLPECEVKIINMSGKTLFLHYKLPEDGTMKLKKSTAETSTLFHNGDTIKIVDEEDVIYLDDTLITGDSEFVLEE